MKELYLNKRGYGKLNIENGVEICILKAGGLYNIGYTGPSGFTSWIVENKARLSTINKYLAKYNVKAIKWEES